MAAGDASDVDEVVAYRFGARIVGLAEAAGHAGGTPVTVADLRVIPGYVSVSSYVRATGDYSVLGAVCSLCGCVKSCHAEEPNARESLACADYLCPCHPADPPA